MAGARRGWRTGKKATGIPGGIPTKARHRRRRTNGVSNGRKKCRNRRLSAFFIRVAKPGRAVERDTVMVRESSGAVKHVIHILRLSGAFHRDIMLLDSWNGFCCTQGPGRGLLFLGFVMSSYFADCQCPECGREGTIIIRTSRKITESLRLYYLMCKQCDYRDSWAESDEDLIWPAPSSDESEIREIFKPWVVRKNCKEIKDEFRCRMNKANAEIKALQKQYSAVMKEIRDIKDVYDILLDIGFGKQSDRNKR
ncbi:hypothetical protein [Chromobacterium rhizoryzae]|uniref:hypothetical protein n=1 Tax=Chromobacterium rhizoryzae TaxID=1778675 RepID=UPI0013C316B0|nr:hypothetical protein [Chromobacterium rhizoryzae]